MTELQTPNDYWELFCGDTPPEEFAGDIPAQIDWMLNAFLDRVYSEEKPIHGDVPEEPRTKVFQMLRRSIRDAVGI